MIVNKEDLKPINCKSCGDLVCTATAGIIVYCLDCSGWTAEEGFNKK